MNGIINDGTLTLNGDNITGKTVTVSDPLHAAFGGGILNDGTLTMNDSATINGNHADTDGGGIYNDIGTLNGAVAEVNVRDNTPDNIVSG